MQQLPVFLVLFLATCPAVYSQDADCATLAPLLTTSLAECTAEAMASCSMGCTTAFMTAGATGLDMTPCLGLDDGVPDTAFADIAMPLMVSGISQDALQHCFDCMTLAPLLTTSLAECTTDAMSSCSTGCTDAFTAAGATGLDMTPCLGLDDGVPDPYFTDIAMPLMISGISQDAVQHCYDCMTLAPLLTTSLAACTTDAMASCDAGCIAAFSAVSATGLDMTPCLGLVTGVPVPSFTDIAMPLMASGISEDAIAHCECPVLAPLVEATLTACDDAAVAICDETCLMAYMAVGETGFDPMGCVADALFAPFIAEFSTFNGAAVEACFPSSPGPAPMMTTETEEYTCDDLIAPTEVVVAACSAQDWCGQACWCAVEAAYAYQEVAGLTPFDCTATMMSIAGVTATLNMDNEYDLCAAAGTTHQCLDTDVDTDGLQDLVDDLLSPAASMSASAVLLAAALVVSA